MIPTMPGKPNPGVLNSMYMPTMPMSSNNGLIVLIQVASFSAPVGLTYERAALA